MIISDKRIRNLVEESSLIVPFSEEKLQSESYDVTIGKEVTIMKKEIHCLDIADQSSIDDIYEQVIIPSDGFIISPKQYILVSLDEKINMPNNITAHLRAKTSYTRLGLIVSDQHCNSTYSGNLRIGLYNATDYPVKIYTGYSIAQIVFEELDDVPSENKLYENKKNAHYQNENGSFRGAKFSEEFLNGVWDKILG